MLAKYESQGLAVSASIAAIAGQLFVTTLSQSQITALCSLSYMAAVEGLFGPTGVIPSGPSAAH
jgi:hypothetical protein